MPQHFEIERKLLVESPPRGWKRRRSSRVGQGYLPVAKKGLQVRLGRKASKYWITFKEGDGTRRLEEEIQMRRRQFDALWPLTRGARIVKRRFTIPCRGETIEFDACEGPHRGLITAEVEFDSINASRSFSPPSWFGREVRQVWAYTNAVLARNREAPGKRKGR